MSEPFLVAARFEIHVTCEQDHVPQKSTSCRPRPLYRAFLYERSIRDGARGRPLAEGCHLRRDKAVAGVLAAALGDLLAERDPTTCDVCGARIGVMGGRDAMTGKVVCPEHALSAAPP